jgi:hypothetical protein
VILSLRLGEYILTGLRINGVVMPSPLSIAVRAEPLSDGPGEIQHRAVLATPDGKHAMGIYTPPQSQPDTTGPSYGRWRFNAEQVVKWNCVFRARNTTGIPPGNFTHHILVPVGTLAQVEAMIRDWGGIGTALINRRLPTRAQPRL